MEKSRDSAEYLSKSALNLEINTVVSGPVAFVSVSLILDHLLSVFDTPAKRQSTFIGPLCNIKGLYKKVCRPISQDTFLSLMSSDKSVN